MYVITHHHDYDEVLLGPIDWKPSFIAAVLRDDLDLEQKPTILVSDVEKVPYDILPNVRVRKVEEVREEINGKIQRHEGPFWTYTDEIGTATFVAVDKPIDLVKGELKSIVASERYNKEVEGITHTINGTDVFVSTDREGRKIYFEKLISIGDTPIQFKFADQFVSVTKSDLQSICTAIETHVQQSFDWEVEKNSEIDACTTLQQLDELIIVENPSEDEELEEEI